MHLNDARFVSWDAEGRIDVWYIEYLSLISLYMLRVGLLVVHCVPYIDKLVYAKGQILVQYIEYLILIS